MPRDIGSTQKERQKDTEADKDIIIQLTDHSWMGSAILNTKLQHQA